MKAFTGFFLLVVVLLTTPVSQSMRVEVKQMLEELGEDLEYISTGDNTVKQVKPGLGWGTLPVADFYTTPLCVDPATGDVPGVVSSSVRQAVKQQQSTYKSSHELNLALGALAEGIGSHVLKASVKSLLARVGGELKSGYEVLHVQYYVPMVRYTINDAAQNCKTAAMQELRDIPISDERQAKIRIGKFLLLHGTQVVQSVILGGHLSLFKVQKSRSGSLHVMKEAASAHMMSDTMHMTILGGEWKATECSKCATGTSDTVLQVVERWLKSVQAAQNLAVLGQQAAPMYVFAPAKMEPLIRLQSEVVRIKWEEVLVGLGERIHFLSEQLHAKQELYKSTKHTKDKIMALMAVVKMASEYDNRCTVHSDWHNSAFVGFHAVPPARCKSRYIQHVLWVCKVALPEMERYKAAKPDAFAKLFHTKKADANAVISDARNLCTRELAQLVPTSHASSSLLESAPPTNSSPIIGLGWSVLPVTDDYVVPFCSTANVLTTTPGEPMRPMIKVYHSDAELEVAFTGAVANVLVAHPVVAAAIKTLLKSTHGKISKGYQFVHVMYYIPMSVQALDDPVIACKGQKIKELEKMHANGTLTENAINRFLLLHGTRVTTSVVLGARLDVFSLQKTGALDLGFLGAGISATKSSQNMHLNVLGGQWQPQTSSGNASNASILTTIEHWVESVKASVNLAALTHTTVPMSALLPSTVYTQVKQGVRSLTSSWMHRIAVAKWVELSEGDLRAAILKYHSTWKRYVQVDAFEMVVGLLTDFCHAAGEYGALVANGFAGLSSNNASPSSFDAYCKQTKMWVCGIAVPNLNKKASVVQFVLRTLAPAAAKTRALAAAAPLCA